MPDGFPKNLPHVAYNYFYYAFTSGGKRLFGLYYGLLVLAVAFMLYWLHQPYGTQVSLQTEGQFFSELLPIEQTTVGLSSQTLTFPVYGQWPRYYAATHPLPLWPVLLFGLFQAFGWAGLLATTSRLKGLWPYALYAGLVFHWVLADLPGLFGLSGYGALAANLPVVALFLVPAFLFQRRRWVRSVPFQVGLYVGLWALLFALAFLVGDAPGLHQAVTFPIPALAVPWLVFLFHTAKDGVNLLLLATTNYEEKARRLPLTGILVLLILWCLTALFLAYRTLDYQLTGPAITLRPLHLLGLLALVTVFTSQNYYHQIRETLTSNLAFGLLILSGGLLTLGLVGYAGAAGERLLLVRTEWIFGLALASVSVWYTAYLLGHFWRFLRERLNLYFVAMEPPVPTTVRFLVVWFLTVALFVFLEGNNNWATIKVMVELRLNQQGDNARLRQNEAEAAAYYTGAQAISRVDPKANFFLAELLLADPDADPAQLKTLYTNAEALIPWPAARLNSARYALSARLDTVSAIRALRAPEDRFPSPEGTHTAAALLRLRGGAAAALETQRAAVHQAPGNPILLATLAQDYWQTGQTEAAQRFYEMARARAGRNPALQQQLLFLELALAPAPLAPGKALPPADTATAAPEARYVLALDAYRRGETARFWALQPASQTLRDRSDFLLLGILGNFLQDSLPLAVSRQQVFQLNQSPFTALASRVMGYGYYRAHMPEMAAPYYFLADSTGWEGDSLLGADMLFEAGALGDASLAYNLVLLQTQPATELPARKRLAYTLIALGEDSLATEVWDFRRTHPHEVLRAAEAAVRWGSFPIANDLFAAVLQADSASLVAHQTRVRGYLHADLPTALAHAETGLAFHPSDPFLQTAAYWLYAQLGESAAADSLWQRMAAATREHPLAQLGYLPRLVARSDTAQARAHAAELLARYPTNSDVLVGVLAYYWQTEAYPIGFQLIKMFAEQNDRNPTLWQWYARFAEKEQFLDFAKYAAQQAVRLSYTPAAKEALGREFATLLARPDPAPTPPADSLTFVY